MTFAEIQQLLTWARSNEVTEIQVTEHGVLASFAPRADKAQVKADATAGMERNQDDIRDALDQRLFGKALNKGNG